MIPKWQRACQVFDSWRDRRFRRQRRTDWIRIRTCRYGSGAGVPRRNAV